MTIDMREVRDDVVGHLVNGANYIRDLPPHDHLMAVGVGLLGVGTILAANAWWNAWRRKKGYRMILQERRDKIDRLLSDGLNDLLFEAELAGKISSKELNAEYQRLADKLNLPDLVPVKRRCKATKDAIKGRFNRGVYGKKPGIVTGKKVQLVERIGTFANQFWRSKRA